MNDGSKTSEFRAICGSVSVQHAPQQASALMRQTDRQTGVHDSIRNRSGQGSSPSSSSSFISSTLACIYAPAD